MPSNPPFVLTRATPSDMKALVDLQYTCFPIEPRSMFMGCPDRTNLPKITQRYIEKMGKDKSDIWLQVKDAQTGKIVAGSNWKVYVNGEPDDLGDEKLDWLEGEDSERSEEFRVLMNGNRRRAMRGPFVHLHICFTSPEYRRMGAGALMMQWGVDLMDSLFVPGWIEASPEGNMLYKAFGFHEYEKVEVNGLPGSNMKRDVRTKGIEGGKAKPDS